MEGLPQLQFALTEHELPVRPGIMLLSDFVSVETPTTGLRFAAEKAMVLEPPGAGGWGKGARRTTTRTCTWRCGGTGPASREPTSSRHVLWSRGPGLWPPLPATYE